MVLSAIICGHSFCKRLQVDMQAGTDARMRPSFKLEETARVRMLGKGGKTIGDFVRRDIPVIQRYRPDILILLLGDNDIGETNDGGVVNDKQMRRFAADCLSALSSNTKASDRDTCTTEGCHGEEGPERNVWKGAAGGEAEAAELVTVNPVFGEGLQGVRILQQLVPFRTSRVKINVTEKSVLLTTTNVRRLTITEPSNRPVHWQQKQVMVDGQFKITKRDMELVLKSDEAHFCKTAGKWGVCTEDVHKETQRGPHTLGPARRVAERDFVIVVGTQSKQHITERLRSYAVYIANLFFLTSDALAPVVKDVDMTAQQIGSRNVILIGGPSENQFTSTFLDKIPVEVKGGTVGLGDCSFSDARMGLLTLAPNGAKRLALILLGTTMEGLADIVSLATPTIPPMARSPFSNLLPDFVITGEDYRRHGPGGFLCAGFWGNQWDLRQDLISCACGAQ